MQNILIIGATSAIAEATARLYANRGDQLYLMGRNEERLEAIANDLAIRGAHAVTTAAFDILERKRHHSLMEQAAKSLDGMDIVLVPHGSLPDQTHVKKILKGCAKRLTSMR